MYLRTIKRKNKDGSVVAFSWPTMSGTRKIGFVQAQVSYSFDRRDQFDVDALKRLIKSLSRVLSHEGAIRLESKSDDLKFTRSLPAGGAYLLKALWQRLGLDDCLKKAFDQQFCQHKHQGRPCAGKTF